MWFRKKLQNEGLFFLNTLLLTASKNKLIRKFKVNQNLLFSQDIQICTPNRKEPRGLQHIQQNLYSDILTLLNFIFPRNWLQYWNIP